MFTGIIEAVGNVISVSPLTNGLQLSISAQNIDFQNAKIGDSIAVNGVCLTATRLSSSTHIFSADVSHETVALTNLKNLKSGSKVHLERALAVGGRFDGHIVTGHVDTTGIIEKIVSRGSTTDYFVKVPESLNRYIAKKGSVAVDGVSLTVNDCDEHGMFRLTIIPHTIVATCIGSWQVGYEPNVEVDILARYTERMSQCSQNSVQKPAESLTRETLQENGFI